MKQSYILVLLVCSIFLLSSCEKEPRKDKIATPDKPIVILYDNDVHCGNDANGYAQSAGLRNAIVASDTAYCLLVSSGDYLQGGVIGTLSKGEDMVTIINRCNYDAMSLGNHEFDFKIPRLLELQKMLKTPVTCCNLTKIGSTVSEFQSYVTVTLADGESKVAFVGVITPEVITSELFAFKDANGDVIYSTNTEVLADIVQNAVDQARSDGAAYVILLSHLGESSLEMSSRKLISMTKNIDAVLDGHTHSVIETEMVADKEGKMVLLSQTGTKFANLGKLYISKDGVISNQLIPIADISYSDVNVKGVVDSIYNANAQKTSQVIATSDAKLTIYDEAGNRIVRKQETNAGNFVADAFRFVGGGEIGITNGGSVRTDVTAGDITYQKLINLTPFGNDLVTIKLTGEEIVQILNVGAEGSQNNKECPLFPVVSGMKYVIEKSGDTRVRSEKVQFFNTATNQYEQLDLRREYIVSGTGYFFDSLDILGEYQVINSGYANEYEALKIFVTDGLHGHIGSEYISLQGRIIFE